MSGVDQHLHELDFRCELAEQRVMFGLGVGRTDADHDISIGAHPLPDKRTVGLMRSDPESRRRRDSLAGRPNP